MTSSAFLGRHRKKPFNRDATERPKLAKSRGWVQLGGFAKAGSEGAHGHPVLEQPCAKPHREGRKQRGLQATHTDGSSCPLMARPREKPRRDILSFSSTCTIHLLAKENAFLCSASKRPPHPNWYQRSGDSSPAWERALLCSTNVFGKKSHGV